MHQLNEEIRDKEVRLIGTSGEQLGIMSSSEALAIAEREGLDLVKISPQATPPVCKLMDYGKFRFEQGKRGQAVHVADFLSSRDSFTISLPFLRSKEVQCLSVCP